MEGLLPLVFKTLRKNKTRRQYECLSSSGGAAAQSYNISDFYAEAGYSYHQPEMRTNYVGGSAGGVLIHSQSINNNGHHHQRRKSFGDYSSTGFSAVSEKEDMVKSKQLVRFRSHRFFSCATGA